MENQYQKFITPDEKIITVFDYSNAELIWDLICVLLVGLLIGALNNFDISWIFIGIVLGSYFLIIGFYRKLTIKYIITNKRVILKEGLIGQSAVSADYSHITDVKVHEGILGRIFLHTGTIILNTAGTDTNEVTLKWIGNPFNAKNIIYEQMHKK